MSPDYRKYFLDKKIKDQELAAKILSIVKHNTQQINDTSNPLRYIMHVDPHFRQNLDEYQQKIVKNMQFIDPKQPRLVYDFDDISTTDSSSEYGLLDRRIK